MEPLIGQIDGASPGTTVPPLTQLMPFNEYRFDDCVAFLADKHDRPLSGYELLKLHVMIDVYHTLDRGKPVIGGKLYPFTNGPVSRSSRSRVAAWHRGYESGGTMPDGFVVIDAADLLRVKPTNVPEAGDFGPSELEAMDRAWKDVVVLLDEKGWQASQDFFHKDGFIGRAWAKARRRGTNLHWDEIIDEYDAAHPGEGRPRIKELIRF